MPPKKKKQVTGGTSPFKGDHTFVNKDASNIDTKDHYAAVSWHVMNRYEKWKKQEPANKSNVAPTTPVSPSETPPTSSAFTFDPQVLFTESLTKPLAQHQQDRRSTVHYPPESRRLETVEQSVQTRQLGPYTPYSPYSLMLFPPPTANLDYMIDSEISDQDEVLSNGVNSPPLINRVLNFTRQVIIPNTWPQGTGRAKWMYELSRASDDISDMYSDILFASASLYLYATLLASYTDETDLASAAYFWQMQAMNELSNRIQSDAGNHCLSTMRAMLKLFSAETALDNTSTARVHLKMLRSIIHSQGGVILLESWFRENLLAADCYFALKCETRPLFTASEWTPGLLSQPWRNNLANAQVFDDHIPTIGTAVEHTQLRALIIDLRELFQAETYVGIHDLQADDQLLRWQQLRKFDCVSRLADHQLNVKLYPHIYQKPKLHAAICTAIALMTAIVLGSPEPIRFGIKLTEELESKFKDARAASTNETASHNDGEDLISIRDLQHVMFWMLYVGLLAEMIFCSTPMSTNFKTMFEEMAVRLSLQTEQEQHSVMKQFLFSSHLEAEISSGRPRRNQDTIKGLYEACGTSWRQPT